MVACRTGAHLKGSPRACSLDHARQTVCRRRVGGGLCAAILPLDTRENARFVMCNKLVSALEMYSFAPIKDTDRRLRGAVGNYCKIRRLEMLGMVARWGHNTLLIGLALMTCVIFFALFK
jgi:hypothetical protein